jgi:hypothetical protein
LGCVLSLIPLLSHFRTPRSLRRDASLEQANPALFLVPDERHLKDLAARVRQLLAWSSIERETEALNLALIAARQAETKRREAELAVATQIGET